ncbi:DNA sulfur modification protein DndD [Geothermobacter hydrogeniphilus]|uniref:DNA sulfur modification protein DndD n=1 Tax=Geothermobacter hydrogeniphilus TaxID=1969733 RepID=A0A2K2H678_9BACT|nr:DNA sulfur modification protein DndD [Geothermobacter hydrogeniphilus]PNU18825.1 DNA sulfur modification protein DndD [Geothermobacter hydrogeniphilus]
MIFEKIVLENFATYKGRNEIKLTPRDHKPIVLIGGENGCGKTSMLDAFQLLLFGPTARCSNRGKLNYETYLKRCINRKADPEEGAVLELTMQFYIGGKLKRYRIRRAWSLKKNKIKERFGAYHLSDDGEKFDAVFSDNWADYVEGIFPSKVAPFFLFDGEKIEQLADFENSGPLIRAAITSLLGLNHVDQLSADLLILEKRKFKELATLEEKDNLEQIEKELADLDKNIADLRAEEARLNNLIDRQNGKLEDIELRYRQQGGELYNRRNELELKLESSRDQVSTLEAELREIAAGASPLLLVDNLLSDIATQAEHEDKAERSRILNEELQQRDEQLLSILKKEALNNGVMSRIDQFLKEDLQTRQKVAETECYLHLSPEAQHKLNLLRGSELPLLRKEISSTLSNLQEANNKLEAIERSLASIPEEETIAQLLAERHQANEEAARLKFALSTNEEELRKAKYKREMVSASLKRELEKTAEKRFEGKDQRRLLQYSAKSRKTLEIFRKKVIKKHLAKIEANVLEAFKKLLRKEGLVHSLEITPETLQLKIFNADAEEIPPDRLSAGERQLLATALLWGICRTAGKPLPTIIDTPLGRLDTSHRTNLVKNYFPCASHQVLLLSTNEEIVGRYYEELSPFISHTALLCHNEKQGGTTVHPGYFS